MLKIQHHISIKVTTVSSLSSLELVARILESYEMKYSFGQLFL